MDRVIARIQVGSRIRGRVRFLVMVMASPSIRFMDMVKCMKRIQRRVRALLFLCLWFASVIWLGLELWSYSWIRLHLWLGLCLGFWVGL